MFMKENPYRKRISEEQKSFFLLRDFNVNDFLKCGKHN